MPGLRDYLDRFRWAGALGAGRTGTPADRPRELEAELTEVLALLDSTRSECDGILTQARHDAEKILAAACAEAAAAAGDADRRAEAAREEAGQQVLTAARAEAASIVARADRQALQVRDRAAQRIPALASRALWLVRSPAAEPGASAAGPPDPPGLAGPP